MLRTNIQLLLFKDRIIENCEKFKCMPCLTQDETPRLNTERRHSVTFPFPFRKKSEYNLKATEW